MIRVLVDSGSSIKEFEKEKYNVDIIPLKILLGNKEYEDGIDLTMDTFYDELINKKQFPKTSLPNLAKVESLVNNYTAQGDDVIILPISSAISGTFNAFKQLFLDNKLVHVIDTLSAVGGIRIIVREINKYRDKTIEFIKDKVNKLIKKIRILAIPETLSYLTRGGRLSKVGFIVGTVLKIIPLITFNEKGKVHVMEKKRGLKAATREVVQYLNEHCDKNYPIVPSYTYNSSNLENMLSLVDEDLKPSMIEYDELDAAISAHWGPNAAGFIFVEKEKE